MPFRKEKFTFSVESLQLLDEGGSLNGKTTLQDHDVKEIYEKMVLTRLLDKTMLRLQREGRCGTYAPSLGQEATQVASAYALRDEDWMFPYFREAGAHIVRKMPLHLYMLYWMGDERGMHIPEHINNFMICIPVATQILHAAGAAYAAKFLRKQHAVLVYLGDGATSEGDFHEGMNFAGAFKLPLVFLCQNNQYAISLHVSKQTAAKTLAQKAVAYGFDGVRVDGNDVFAVYEATRTALEKARQGGGPTFIECVTYRMSDHTTSDDAKRYRSEEELEEWRKRDPIERLRKYLESKGMWSKQYEEKTVKEAEETVNAAVRLAESQPAAPVDDMFAYTYAEMPKQLREQLNSLTQNNMTPKASGGEK